MTSAGGLLHPGLAGMHSLSTTLEQCSSARVSTFAPGVDPMLYDMACFLELPGHALLTGV
jgi:hypothetical protein